MTSASNPGQSVILTPLASEAAALRRAIPEANIITIGMRAAAMRPPAEFAASGVGIAIVAGFGGGVARFLRCGDVVVDGPPPGFAPPDRCVVGAIHTAPEIVATPAEKAAVHARTGALAVDMELALVRKVLIPLGIEVVGVRAILDPADRTLPSWLAGVVGADGRPGVGALAAAVARDPRRVVELVLLQRASGVAGRALGQAVSAVLSSMSRQGPGGPGI